MTLVYSSLYWISALGMIISATFTGGARLIDAEFEAQKTWSNLEKYKVRKCVYRNMYRYHFWRAVYFSGHIMFLDSECFDGSIQNGSAFWNRHQRLEGFYHRW